MTRGRYRVAQWGTGDVGRRTMREVIRHPDFDLVGALVYDPEKVGRDAGEICGEPPTGIAAVADREAIFALNADCVIYTPRAIGQPHARAGLTVAEVLDDVCTMLAAGTNVITTVTDFHGGGNPKLGDGIERIQAAGRAGNASLYATGSDPGYVLEQISYAFLASQRDLRQLKITEYGDMSKRPSPHMLFEQVGFGKPKEAFDSDTFAANFLEDYGHPVAKLAEAAGFVVDDVKALWEGAVVKQDTKLVAGEIKAGTLAGHRITYSASSGGRDVVQLVQYMFVSKDLEPHWDIRELLWRIEVDGDAPYDLNFVLPFPVEQMANYVPAYNGNLAVNAIPYICDAPPGIVSTEQLEPILPSGPLKFR